MCVFHFMKDITQCNINTNSKHNSKLIDYGSKNKQPFTKDSTKEILKKFVILLVFQQALEKIVTYMSSTV